MKGRIVIFALLLAGCGHSSSTRFWTLDAVAPESSSGNRFVVHDFDRWCAPLGEAIRRVLTQDLVARLPANSVVFPAAPKPPGCRSLVVDILTLQPSGTGWVADVAWSVSGPTSAQRGQARISATGAATPEGQAAAISALAGQLADTLVPVLQSSV